MSWFSNSGMHWSRSQNRRLRNLAEVQAFQFSPWMEDAEEESDGTIDVCFGSQGATLMLRRIDSEAMSLFRQGHCAMLAWAMHLKTGLPFAVFTVDSNPEWGWQGHVGLLVGENQILDIAGVNTAESIASGFKGMESSFQVLDADEFKQLIVGEEYHNNPLDFLCELEQLVLDDFADFVLAENKTRIKELSLSPAF